MADDERTVCVWESGGVYSASDWGDLQADVARALGAAPECVRVLSCKPATGGVWLTTEIFAPDVPVDWASARGGAR
jgi:hypothetical protein